MARYDWGPKHEEHVYWAEKGFSLLAFIVGVWIILANPDGGKLILSIGVGFSTVGVVGFLPSLRPFISGVVHRIPLLASRNPAPLSETEEEK